MGAAKNEYLKRIEGNALFSMTSLHHHIMERVVADLGPRFGLSDLLSLLESDHAFCENRSIGNNPHRVKLFALQTLQALVAVHMVEMEDPPDHGYWLKWPTCSSPTADSIGTERTQSNDPDTDDNKRNPPEEK